MTGLVSLTPRKILVAALWLSLGTCTLWTTFACAFGTVEYTVPRQQMRGGRVEACRVAARPFPWPRHLDVEVAEDGRVLGPEVTTPKLVSEELGGTFAVVVKDGPGLQRFAVVHFSASDGSKIRENGRSYAVRYSRRQLPATLALVLVLWTVVPLVVVRLSRSLAPSAGEAGAAQDVAAWSVLVVGAVYSVFASQAWLFPSNGAWLLLAVAPGVAPFLASLPDAMEEPAPGWLPWVAGLGAWAVSTSAAGSVYSSPRTALVFVAVTVGGALLYFGLRGSLRRPGERADSFLFALLAFTVVLSLVKESGFGLTRKLALLELSPTWTGGLVSSWTTKFVAHWTLILGWSALVALSESRRRGRRDLLLIAILVVVATGLTGSKSAIVALGLSVGLAAVSYLWRSVRLVAVVGLICGVLLAPLWAGVPWRVERVLPEGLAGGPLSGLELDVRGTIWEFARRCILVHPVTGWGFGASADLPARRVPMAAALDLDAKSRMTLPAREMALPGGHPHNAALLTWLDLGLIGALLLAGLLWSIGRAIAATEDQKLTHASLLGLLTVNACFLAFNYPAWQPEILSILWMSAVLAAAVLPLPRVGRVELRRSVVAVVVVLGIGGGLLAQGRVSRWLTMRELREERVTLLPERGELTVGDETWPLRYSGDLEAGAKLVEAGAGGRALVRGWAYSPEGKVVGAPVLVFVGPVLAGVSWAERPSPEVFLRTRPRDVRALVSGFELFVNPNRLDLSDPVTVVVGSAEHALAAKLPPL